MGCKHSQHKVKPSVTDFRRLESTVDNGHHCNDSDNNNSDSVTETIRKYDAETIRIITKDLNETPELFVLNNVLMGMMFYENYQKDINNAAKNRYNKSEKCIYPDAMLEKVNRNLTFRPLHGSNKCTPTPLVTKRIYVADDTIEVFHPMDVPDCDKKSSKCQLKMEDCKRNGFVKLQELDSSSIPYDTNLSVMSEPTPSTSDSSSDTESSDTTYDNSNLLNSRTPKSIMDDVSDSTAQNAEREVKLNSCFVYRKKKKPQVELDLEDMDPKDITDEHVYDLVSYLSSRGFMKYFRHSVFPNTVAEELGFQRFEIELSRWIPGKVFCNLNDDSDNIIPCEIIPCLRISWPESQTFQFTNRENTIQDNNNEWPTQKMLNDIRSLECALVPRGYVKKKRDINNGEEGDLEWEIHFPHAERYLESFMSHAQTRCLLVLLGLHKTYIEPVTHQYGLLTEHIRTHIYWEIENNYRDWPEHRMGIKIINVIKNLSRGLRQRRLNDYFVQKKNLFRNIPSRYLEHSNKLCHDIVQSPLMYFIKSLRNIRYSSGKFYPPLDFKELKRILTNKGMQLTNPILLSLENISDSVSSTTRKSPNFGDAEVQLRYANELRKKEEILKKREKEKNGKKESHLVVKPVFQRSESVDSIDLDWACEAHFDIHKKRALIVLFTKTYIDIAKTSSRIGPQKQTLFYLKQAWYLSKILGSVCPAFEDESNELLATIKSLEDEFKRVKTQDKDTILVNGNQNNNKSEDISRKKSEGLHQQLKNSVVYLNKLHDSYDGGRPPEVS